MENRYSRDVSLHRRAATHVNFAVCLWRIGTVETFLCIGEQQHMQISRCAYGESVQSRRFFASASSNTCKFRGVLMENRYSRDVSLHRRAATHAKFRGVLMENRYSRDVSLHRRAATHVNFAVCLYGESVPSRRFFASVSSNTWPWVT